MEGTYKPPEKLWPQKFQLVVNSSGAVQIRRMSGEVISALDANSSLSQELCTELKESGAL